MEDKAILGVPLINDMLQIKIAKTQTKSPNNGTFTHMGKRLIGDS